MKSQRPRRGMGGSPTRSARAAIRRRVVASVVIVTAGVVMRVVPFAGLGVVAVGVEDQFYDA